MRRLLLIISIFLLVCCAQKNNKPNKPMYIGFIHNKERQILIYGGKLKESSKDNRFAEVITDKIARLLNDLVTQCVYYQ